MALSEKYFFIVDGELVAIDKLPAGSRQLVEVGATLLPPHISRLQRSLRAWHDAQLSLGCILPQRFWLLPEERLAVGFAKRSKPEPATFTSKGREIAGWLLLLDKWMETFVVVARARTVWSVAELGAALPFLAPAYLSADLLHYPPENWQRLAQVLAIALADGEMSGEPDNRHWQR